MISEQLSSLTDFSNPFTVYLYVMIVALLIRSRLVLLPLVRVYKRYTITISNQKVGRIPIRGILSNLRLFKRESSISGIEGFLAMEALLALAPMLAAFFIRLSLGSPTIDIWDSTTLVVLFVVFGVWFLVHIKRSIDIRDAIGTLEKWYSHPIIVSTGLNTAIWSRRRLIELSKIGLPLATEALDPISPQYLQDTITWTAIGARTTESQTHREMSSGLSSPVGFKNGTDGSLDVAVNAMKSVVSGHAFLGINPQGQVAITKTKGNQYGHVVLRGGGGKPNYDSVSVTLCEQALEKANLPTNIVIDCSHANSNKDHNVQPLVLDDITHQIKDGNRSICGVMIESNINEGNQSIPDDLSQLKYGVSVTDACISWESTEKSLKKMADTLSGHLQNRRV